MTEMAVVTDLTVGDYWDQLPEYSKQASDLGVSINSAYEAATLYYQQGLKGNEVTKISAETLKMAKIAGLDAADATDKMTAALRGFNMELNETSAQRVSDVYSELAAITAADVDEISNAMTKTASIAHSAGMEFETTAAFLSQIIETTRESAETAGTALKTVIARFQELKKDPAEIGEVDGEIVDANKIETALRSVGVALRDSSGQFRELDDVFLELSSKWDGLDKNTQRYIATIAAGSRQQSRFIAMMSDYGRTQELVASANNSAGASQKQFEKTTESLEYKVERLKNAWHEFTMGIMDSDLLKFGVDILSKFLEIVNKATSALDGVGGSLVKIVSILGVFKLGQKIFNKIKIPLINFFADVVKLSREKGEESGRAFDEGARSVVNEKQNKTEEQITDKDLENYNPTSFKKRAGQFIKDKTGVTEIGSGWSAIYGKDSKKDGGLRDSQSKLAKLKQDGGDRKARLKKLETAQTDEEIKQAKKELLEYDKA
jgi:TP901 family phage tail tape measure protein